MILTCIMQSKIGNWLNSVGSQAYPVTSNALSLHSLRIRGEPLPAALMYLNICGKHCKLF